MFLLYSFNNSDYFTLQDSIFYIIDNSNITSNQACAIVIPNQCGDVPDELGFNIDVDNSIDSKVTSL